MRGKGAEIGKNKKVSISDGGSVLFLPIPIQGSLVIPIPIPCSKNEVYFTVYRKSNAIYQLYIT